MLDLKRIQAEKEKVEELLARKGFIFNFDEVLELDVQRKAVIGEVEKLKAERNKVSAEIPKLKKEGKDVTAQFEEGARRVLEIAKKNGVRVAILKEGSPSCGSKRINDGTFTGTKIPGEGVLARLLIENGIPVFNENEVHLAMVLASGDPSNHHHG